jgi:hypothetical protein
MRFPLVAGLVAAMLPNVADLGASATSRCGGIGIRTGLKILYPQGFEGSTPSTGTTTKFLLQGT